MTDLAILVTGATGNTGSRVVSRLTALGHTVTAASRRATAQGGAQAVRFDWHDPTTYGDALRGADRVYLVPPIGDPDPAAVMVPFLEQARSAGVRRVALLSSSAIPAGDPAVGQVHGLLARPVRPVGGAAAVVVHAELHRHAPARATASGATAPS